MQSQPDPPKDPEKQNPPSGDQVREPPEPAKKEREEKFPRKGDLPDTAP